MKKPAWMNMNLMGLVILLLGYLTGVGTVLSRSFKEGALSEATGTGKRVITLMHWQLEPGYREAMQKVMDRYNALPRVKAANVEVRQLDVTERVYGQVLNVNLISGTAPDISEKGMGGMLNGAGMAQYFDSLSDFAQKPNPYNSPKYLPPDIDPKLAHRLSTLPWRETFIDGMNGGWVDELQDVYSAPSSFFGTVKIYYNVQIIMQAKAVLRAAAGEAEPPGWFSELFLKSDGDTTTGYVVDTPQLRAWIDNDQIPTTLGRLLMICAGVDELARQTHNPKLVAIAGSNYSDKIFADQYLGPFTSPYSDELDFDMNSSVTGSEVWLGWLAKQWSFDDTRIRQYFDCVTHLTRYFPPGFLGLDREQARRRFVTAQAAMIATGSWDARSLFEGAKGSPASTNTTDVSRDEEYTAGGTHSRFDIKIMDFPLPGPNERWHEYITYPASSAQASGGASYSIYQRSPNKSWAIDFLRYLTSYQVNEEFNRDAGWLPIIIGAESLQRLKPFRPNAEGLQPGSAINFRNTESRKLLTHFEGQSQNLVAGDIDYQTFVSSMQRAASDPRSGANDVLASTRQATQDNVRSFEQLLNTQIAAIELLGSDTVAGRHRRSLRQSVLLFNANDLLRVWQVKFPGNPFPSN